MLQEVSAKKQYNDEWETGSREGYEDRGAFRAPRAAPKREGRMLRTLGGVAIVGGMAWGAYVATQNGVAGVVPALQENHGPVAVIALGAVSSLLGKYLRV